MEITHRDNIGADLKAPSAARGGVATASYHLVHLNLVQPADVVVHYEPARRLSSGLAWQPARLSKHQSTWLPAEAMPGARASGRSGGALHSAA